MLKKLLVLSFIEGMAVMTAELCGAKLLAPVYGSSLYVWAAVMGVTLAALALGYFFGGSLSGDNSPVSTYLFRVLACAALLVMLMPVLSHYLIPRISYLSFLPAVVISTFLLLWGPVFLLGTSSPLFIALQAEGGDSGKVSGTVYAVSTAGGILATFLCGFYFIPHMGLSLCLVCFGGALFVAAMIVLKRYSLLQLLLFAGFIYLNIQFAVKKEGQLFVSDSILGHLEVEEFARKRQSAVRILKVNNIIQTEMDLSTRQSVSAYVHLLDTLVAERTMPGSALVLGLGGGLTANLLQKKNYRVDGVELDERIVQAARDYFYLDKRVNVFPEDARYFLNHCSKKYDLVLIDVFKAEEQPSHVLTRESLKKLKNNLNEQGAVLVNWHGYVLGTKGLGSSILYNTFLNSGFHIQLCAMSADENHRNVIFVASLKEQRPLPFGLKNEHPAQTELVNTDNSPLLEAYNAEANKIWRSNYLRYYQDQGAGRKIDRKQ